MALDIVDGEFLLFWEKYKMSDNCPTKNGQKHPKIAQKGQKFRSSTFVYSSLYRILYNILFLYNLAYINK